MNNDWLKKCWAFAKTTEMSEARAVQLSLLIWVNRDIGAIEDFDSSKYSAFAAILEGSKPFPGAWVKSADRKKVKGVPRPDNDPTCYSFQEFWADYGYKTGKPGSKEIWALYDEAKRERIKQHLPGYIAKTTTQKKQIGGNWMQPRAMPQSYLRDKDMKYWKGDWEVEPEILVEVDQKNLDGLFEKLNISLPYQLVPSKEALSLALDDFKSSVEDFDERKFVNAIQDYYDEKGQYGGRLTSALRSQDLRNYYLSRFKK